MLLAVLVYRERLFKVVTHWNNPGILLLVCRLFHCWANTQEGYLCETVYCHWVNVSCPEAIYHFTSINIFILFKYQMMHMLYPLSQQEHHTQHWMRLWHLCPVHFQCTLKNPRQPEFPGPSTMACLIIIYGFGNNYIGCSWNVLLCFLCHSNELAA